MHSLRHQWWPHLSYFFKKHGFPISYDPGMHAMPSLFAFQWGVSVLFIDAWAMIPQTSSILTYELSPLARYRVPKGKQFWMMFPPFQIRLCFRWIGALWIMCNILYVVFWTGVRLWVQCIMFVPIVFLDSSVIPRNVCSTSNTMGTMKCII